MRITVGLIDYKSLHTVSGCTLWRLSCQQHEHYVLSSVSACVGKIILWCVCVYVCVFVCVNVFVCVCVFCVHVCVYSVTRTLPLDLIATTFALERPDETVRANAAHRDHSSRPDERVRLSSSMTLSESGVLWRAGPSDCTVLTTPLRPPGGHHGNRRHSHTILPLPEYKEALLMWKAK